MALKRSLPFAALQTSNIASGVGNGIVMITVPWLVLELTNSPSAAGLLGALASLPGNVGVLGSGSLETLDSVIKVGEITAGVGSLVSNVAYLAGE
ncbi:MAG: hypothetical protein ACKOEJ_02665, partial [Acidimicrobiaceae bacterium]